MKRSIIITIPIIVFVSFFASYRCYAQENKGEKGYLVPVCVYEGETIPYVQLPVVYVFKPIVCTSEREKKEYNKLVHDVKKILPVSREVKLILSETYEYMQMLPNEKSKQAHIKIVEKGFKEQYDAQIKTLTFSQGKLLIKLIDRACNQTSYDLVKALMGSFKAVFYQSFGGLFGVSLKKEYNPQGEDKLVERVILLVESGQI
ncbi:hypothetical protein EZS27_025555 [termite gut metagenome]|uniref:DUF4294 domain-containing protein n=1 Tax=termite gut metagenome TaxID=433724 RepID=A0A5J4QVR7_9ZZZZ